MPGEGHTYVGNVVGRGVVAARAEMRVDGERSERTFGKALTLRLDDGSTVTVRTRPRELAVRPRREHRGKWSDVADSPLGVLFRDRAPGDHLDVALEGWMIEADTRIAVRAVAGVARTVVCAEGDDAAALAQLDEADAEHTRAAAPDQPKRPRAEPARSNADVPWRIAAPVLGVLGLALVAIGVVVPLLLPSGAMLVASALALRLSLPPFVANEPKTPLPPRPPWQIGSLVAWLIAGNCMVLPLTVLAGAWLGYAYVAIAGLALVAVCGAKHRSARRLARLLLGGARDGACFEGTLDGPTIPLTIEYVQKIVDRSYTHYESGLREGTVAGWHRVDSFDHWLEPVSKMTALDDFVIRDGDRRVHVTGGRGLCGAPFVFQPVEPYEVWAKRQERAQARAIERGDTRAYDELRQVCRPFYITSAELHDGDSVLVRARVDDGTIDASGREALVMFAAPEDARGALRRLVWRWRGKALLLAAIAAGCAATAALELTDLAADLAADLRPPRSYHGPAERP